MDKTKEVATFDVFKLELVQHNCGYEDGYKYESEDCLYMRPANACLLAIIKSPDIQVENSIGKTLKKHNIFDYSQWRQEPDIDSFYRSIAFASLYKASETEDTSIEAEDVTVSAISMRYPEKMIGQLNETGMAVEKTGNGIYHVKGRIPFRFQIIVFQEISKEEQVWLEGLLQYIQNEYVQRVFLELGTYSKPQ